jgi:hypothetical protein
MPDVWDNLDPLETALVTTDLIADLNRRMFIVAKVRAEAVQRMKAEGSTVREICKELGLSRYVVCSLLKMPL